ncbi:MAG: hypothetical protein K6G18_11680 [Treponema sp.]|nr:hypothetical protein [Treponema sp.]
MKKTKILSVVLVFLSCAALLGSCDYWKEDFYKNGGDSGSEASGGSGSSSGGSGSSVSDCPVNDMDAEAWAVHDRMLGTHWKYEVTPMAQRTYDGGQYECWELTINADGSGVRDTYYEDKNGVRIAADALRYGVSEVHLVFPSFWAEKDYWNAGGFSGNDDGSSVDASNGTEVWDIMLCNHSDSADWIGGYCTNIGDLDGDGVLDTPFVPHRSNGTWTKKWYTRLN